MAAAIPGSTKTAGLLWLFRTAVLPLRFVAHYIAVICNFGRAGRGGMRSEFVMAFEVESGLVFNSIFWLTSPQPDEVSMVEAMMDDVSVICQAKGIPFHKYVVPSGDDLIRALAEIEVASRQGLKPLIYLDMHGSAADGVEIAAANEMVSWDRVVDALRAINRETGNNLLVVAGVCYGLHAIRETIITEHAPFYMLIAPEEKITFGDLIDQTFPFFQDLTTNLDVVKAAKDQLSPKMKIFHCLRVFTVAMAKYIRRNCQGKGAAERREYLLSEVLKSGVPLALGGLADLRKQIKQGIRPSQEMLDNYSETFLGIKPLGYDLERLLHEIEKAEKTV